MFENILAELILLFTTVATTGSSALVFRSGYKRRVQREWESCKSRGFDDFRGEHFKYLRKRQIIDLIRKEALNHSWRIAIDEPSGDRADFHARVWIRDKTGKNRIFLRCKVESYGKFSQILYEWSVSEEGRSDDLAAVSRAMQGFIDKLEQSLAEMELKRSASEYRLGGTRTFGTQAFSADIVKTVLTNAIAATDDYGKSISFKIAGKCRQHQRIAVVEADVIVENSRDFQLRFYSRDNSSYGVKAWELVCDWNGSFEAMTEPLSSEWEIVRGLFALVVKMMMEAGAVPCFPSDYYPNSVDVGSFEIWDFSHLARTLSGFEEYISVPENRHYIGVRRDLSLKHVPGAAEFEIGCYYGSVSCSAVAPTESELRFNFINFQYSERFAIRFCLQLLPHAPRGGRLILSWSGTKKQSRDEYHNAPFFVDEVKNRLCRRLFRFGAVAVDKLKLMQIQFLGELKGAVAASPIAHRPRLPGMVEPASSSPWPTPQDYNEAVQSPAASFADPELKSGSVLLNNLGMPRATSGAFASVYKLSCAGHDWAVRCFNSPVKDQLLRYEKTSRFVCADDLPYTVSCEFLDSGVRIDGKWYPLVKMEWVEGTELNTYISEIVKDKDALVSLRTKFSEMMVDLQRNGIAHGDLQHGNIIIRNGEFVLVDYDNMFVPELAGFVSWETGHRNYQHPRRDSNHFGPYLDHFSAWVIDTALLCLVHAPEFWYRFGAGDESLLFTARDFLKPDDSLLFQMLLYHKNAEISERARKLVSLLAIDLPDLPPLTRLG